MLQPAVATQPQSDELELALFALGHQFAKTCVWTMLIQLKHWQNSLCLNKLKILEQNWSDWFQVETYPITTASCERGFSQLNLTHTKVRNRLYPATVGSLLMVSINGPPASHFNARKYVITWLKVLRKVITLLMTSQQASNVYRL